MVDVIIDLVMYVREPEAFCRVILHLNEEKGGGGDSICHEKGKFLIEMCRAVVDGADLMVYDTSRGEDCASTMATSY